MNSPLDVTLLGRARVHGDRLAILDQQGAHTYSDLIAVSQRFASFLLGDQPDLLESRVSFMVPPGLEYVGVQWGIWRAGGVAVPLCPSHPPPELEHVVADSGAETVVFHPQFQSEMLALAKKGQARFLSLAEMAGGQAKRFPGVDPQRRAMVLYTSGTTSKPKGVVMTHRNITAQIETLTQAWEWTAQDRILHVLPLHHTHGIVNALLCALWSGAACEMLPRFDAAEVWKRFVQPELTLFMAVPTIYAKLIRAWEESTPAEQERMSKACRKFRVMVSGSAALPVSVFEKWREITGVSLLERYGMTEIGMVLSNPLHGERRPGTVGQPLPGVQVRLVDEAGQEIREEAVPGELQVRGPSVFQEYLNKPEVTAGAFCEGWFCTGDEALRDRGYYRILGRRSEDIIKTGGYKISALEVEATLVSHPAIEECAVVSIPDKEWGERVCAGVVFSENEQLSLDELRDWAAERMAKYKVPTRLLVLPELPRNAMGKVTKTKLRDFWTAAPQGD